MSKKRMLYLAMLGVSIGLSSCQGMKKTHGQEQAESPQLSPELQSFYASLDDKAKSEFMELDAQHRMMAIEMALQNCNGKNMCAGMGGCKTVNNNCAGLNSCKGLGGPPVKTPEEAVNSQLKQQEAEQQKYTT